MNLILEKTTQVPYFTNMSMVLNALKLKVSDYDWFVSDIETNCCEADFPTQDQWISGEKLQALLEKNEIQFIWSVFSAVPKGFRTIVEEAPYIEDNPSYWKGKDISPQLKGGLFEIACWDSSATILVGLPAKMTESFMQAYPDTRPLISAAR